MTSIQAIMIIMIPIIIKIMMMMMMMAKEEISVAEMKRFIRNF